MTKLITIADIKLYKALSSNINALKIDSEINEAQEFDLRPLLGDEFFMALLDDFNASPSLSTYDDLFNGSTYTYQGNTYQHDGLKAMLCYYTYARFLNKSNTNSTPFGMVVKQTAESEPISEKTLSRLVTQTLNGAKIYENRVMDFLKRNESDYPLFKCENRQPQSNGIRITAIRKDR
jgi:hypothetical protein